nr:helix-turn-helix domain-containing protein [Streptomyces nanshensis]
MAGGALPRLYTPEEVADVFGCSDWWLKEQARRRRVPFTRVGGAYRFTEGHVIEIVRLFEERPAEERRPVERPRVAASGDERRRQPFTSPVQQLRARPPRRRTAEQPAA